MGEQKKDLLTVAELADRVGLTKQAVYKRLDNSLKEYVKIVDGQKMLKVSVLELYDNKPDSKQLNTDVDKKVEQLEDKYKQQLNKMLILVQMLKSKDLLITEKDNQIEQLKQQIEYLQNELSKANNRVDEEQQIIKMLSMNKVEQIEVKAEPEEQKKGLFGKIFK